MDNVEMDNFAARKFLDFLFENFFAFHFQLFPVEFDSILRFMMANVATSKIPTTCVVYFISGESVNACAGLGYNGLDERGVARWDLIDNADIYKVEVSSKLFLLRLLINGVNSVNFVKKINRR